MADITADFVCAAKVSTQYASNQLTPCPNALRSTNMSLVPSHPSSDCHLLSHLAATLAHATFSRRRGADTGFAFKNFPELEALVGS